MSEKAQVTKLLIVKNGLFSLMSWVFPILITLIVTPVIVHGLGLKAYGLFAVIYGFISYSFTFGIGRVAAKYVAELHPTDESERMSAAISAAFIISVLLGLFVIVLVAFTADYLVTELLVIPDELHSIATSALYVASITILITMVSQVFQFMLQGLHRFDRFLLIANIAAVGLSIGNVGLVLNGFGVVALIVWNATVVGVGAVFFGVSAMRLLPTFKPTLSVNKNIWKAVLVYALSIVGYQSFGNALLLFERAWIVRKFGTESLTFYVVPMALCIYFHALVASLVVVLFPVVNQLLKEKDKILRLYRTSTKAILALTAFFVVTITVTGQLFLRTWMGSDEFSQRSGRILIIHAVTFAILAVTTVPWQLTESFGVARLNAIATGAWFFISVPLMVVLAETWQTEGVAAARLLGVLALIPLIGIVEHRFLGGLLKSFWVRLTAKLAVAVAASAVVQWSIVHWLTGGWFSIALAGSLGGLAFVGILWLVGFVDSEERDAFSELFGRARKAISG
ncbi:MAG: hypothetical protein WBO10_15325 [Pyrinomonadaceae bacterium]